MSTSRRIFNRSSAQLKPLTRKCVGHSTIEIALQPICCARIKPADVGDLSHNGTRTSIPSFFVSHAT